MILKYSPTIILVEHDKKCNEKISTDLQGGNFEELMQSLSLIFKLPDDTRVYPGHGFLQPPEKKNALWGIKSTVISACGAVPTAFSAPSKEVS